MKCGNCSAEIPDGSVRCPQCGKDFREDQEIITAPSLGETPGDREPSSQIDSAMRPFKDPDFLKKITIGGLLSLIPFVGQIFALGYEVEYIRRIIFRENHSRLPEWENRWGDYLTNGLMLFLAMLVYLIIISLISVASFMPFFSTLVAMGKSLEHSNDPAAFCGAFMSLIIPVTIITVVICIFFLIVPFLQVLYSKGLKFGDAFNIGGALKLITTDISGYIVACLIATGVALAAFTAMTLIGTIALIPILGHIVAFVGGAIISFGCSLSIVSIFAELYYKNKKPAGLGN